MRGHLALARIGSLLPLEVLINVAALHRIALRSAHRVNDNFLVSEGGCEGRIRLFYKNLERKRLKVSAVGREACFTITQGAIQIRRGSKNANVIFRKSRT